MGGDIGEIQIGSERELYKYIKRYQWCSTQAPIRVCLDGTNIDSRTILVTMDYCG